MSDNRLNKIMQQIDPYLQSPDNRTFIRPKDIHGDTYECREVPDGVKTPAFLDLGSEIKSDRIAAAKILRGEPGPACILRRMSYATEVRVAWQLLQDLDPNAYPEIIASAALQDDSLLDFVFQHPEILPSKITEVSNDFNPADHFLALVRVVASMRADEYDNGLSYLFLQRLLQMKEIINGVLPELAMMLGERQSIKSPTPNSILTTSYFFAINLSVPAMALLGRAGEAAIPVLVERHIQGSPVVQQDVIKTIQTMKKGEQAEAVKEFIALLSDSNVDVRLNAIKALSELATKEDHNIVPAITFALRDENLNVRREAILSLVYLALKTHSPNVYLALPDLGTIASNPAEPEDLRNAAQSAIRTIEEEAP